MSGEPRCLNDLERENAALWQAFDAAAETITALSGCIGREDFDGERKAMVKVDEWSKLRKRLAHLRGDHRRGMVIKALEAEVG